MILTTENRDVTRSQEFKTQQYGVDASNLPLLFQLLRTNLYSDLPGSILRELVSNVIDSHTEAGKPEALGEVQWIPSSKLLGQDCELIIRDYGVGLSTERMSSVYGNYLSSTKRNDNSSIGGFGLGSKVPFAYTDSFSVQTVYDKVRYRYLCYIDESQLGAISLLAQEQTTDINQTEIIIPIKNESRDYQMFQKAVTTQLGYFKTIKYKGFTEPNPEIKFENSICILKETPPILQLHIVLGTVAYEIDYTQLGIQPYDWNRLYGNCGIGIKFNIGELQPTMSRESLFWNDSTKKKVLDRLEEVKKSIRDEITKELDATTDYGKWFGYVSSCTSKSFSRQWNFASIKNKAILVVDGISLPILNRSTEWFAGHNVRKVVRPQYSYRRSRKTSNPDYTVERVDDIDFERLTTYRIDRNLNAATCLFLFNKHPEGFLVISEAGAPVDDEILMPYYTATKKWVLSLPDFDAIEVPDGSPTGYEDTRAQEYRELVKLRKLEGKFTAKVMRVPYNEFRETSFIYNNAEYKFENMKNNLIVYGFQDEHEKMCEVAATISYSTYDWKRFTESHDKPILILKIGQKYEKQFFALPNAYHVDEVLGLKSPFNEIFASIKTALSIVPIINTYYTLNHFEHINSEMCNKYKLLRKFVMDYTNPVRFQSSNLEKKIATKNINNVNIEFESDWEEIKEYFSGAELLKSTNFQLRSNEDCGYFGSKTVDGSSRIYIRNWVHQNNLMILDYLLIKNKQVNGTSKSFIDKRLEINIEHENLEELVIEYELAPELITV